VKASDKDCNEESTEYIVYLLPDPFGGGNQMHVSLLQS